MRTIQQTQKQNKTEEKLCKDCNLHFEYQWSPAQGMYKRFELKDGNFSLKEYKQFHFLMSKVHTIRFGRGNNAIVKAIQ